MVTGFLGGLVAYALNRRGRRTLAGYLFLAPYLVVTLVFTVGVLLFALYAGYLAAETAVSEPGKEGLREGFRRRCASTPDKYRERLIEVYGEEQGKKVVWYNGTYIPPFCHAHDLVWVHGEAWSAMLAARHREVGALLCAVEYDDGPPWPVEADGGGSSLECLNPRLPIDTARNWMPSRPGWRRIAYDGVASSSVLYVYLLGPGRCIIDDVAIAAADGGAVSVPNGAFDAGLAPWQANGNECAVYFCAPYWPQFRKIDLLRAVRVYRQRVAQVPGT